MRRLLLAVAAGAALAATACSGLGGAVPTPTPSPKSELVLGLGPSRAPGADAARQLAEQLSGLVKVPVVVRLETTAAALDADLASGAVDLAWADSVTYVALRQRHPLTPVLRAARCYPTYTPAAPAADCKPQPGVPAIMVCGARSAVPELADGGDWSALKGRSLAVQGTSSLTGYVWPRYYLARNHVDPDKDLVRGPVTPSDMAVALAVYNGLVDCGAMGGDGRAAAVRVVPDVFDRTKVVFVAPGTVPGDAVFVGSGLNSAQASRLRAALLRLGVAPAASGPIQALTGGDATAMLGASDRDYDLLRAAVAAVNPKLVEQVVPPSPAPSRRPPGTPTPR